ncbi:MAG: flagellar hook-associated family protein [Alphaproteobacteria bacterium]|nr:flagellar hook-associated family protein [Alphaproteobacteria bacterium]
MKTTFISTQSIGEATRSNIMRSQTRLSEAQTELGTGKLYDTGIALGGEYSNLVDLRQQFESLLVFEKSNAVLQTRLEVSEAALQSLVDGAQDFISELIAARQAPSGGELIQESAKGRLQGLVDQMNVSYNGEFLFSGINVSQPPFADYWSDPPPASRAAVAASFLAEFGVAQGDPGAQSITPVAMDSFLDGTFADLFEDPGWESNWSSASSGLATVRIGRSETITPSVSANENAIRKLAQVYAAAADLGTANLSKATFEAVIDNIVTVAGGAVQELSGLQSSLGLSQARLATATDRGEIQRSLLQDRIGRLEGVDPFEASTRITSLLTQIEASYAVTARIQRLTILNYL